MPRTITISLPVADVKTSTAFYTALGFVGNPLLSQYADETAAFLTWSETINLVLLSYDKWRNFTTRPIPPTTSSEVALMLSCESRAEVDAMNQSAVEHGGIGDINPVQDEGYMYGRDFADPDGHVWGALWAEGNCG